MLKILNICHLYHPSFGGCQIYMKELSEKLAKLNEKVTVFAPRAVDGADFSDKTVTHGDLCSREIINGVEVRRFPIRHYLYEFIFHQLGRLLGGYRFIHSIFNEATLRNLKKGPFIPDMIFEILRYRPDVVILLSVHKAHSYLCYVAKKFFHFPLIVIPSLHAWKYDRMVHKILLSADAVIAFTEYEKAVMVAQGIDEKKISVIGNGTEPARFLTANGQNVRTKYNLDGHPIVTYIGTKIKGKGVKGLIQAMDIVWKDVDNVQLVLAGNNNKEYASVIRNQFNSLSAANRAKIIEINGFADKEKADIFDACDIFVMVSKIDTFGIVYLEAWNSGKPIIACKGSPSSSFMDEGKDALLVEYDNVQELAAAIKKLLGDAQLRKTMGENGRRKVQENYTWDIITNRIRKKCYELVKSGDCHD